MQNRRSFLPYIYLVVGAVFVLAWPYIQNQIWPPPEKPKPILTKDAVAVLAGGLGHAAEEVETRKLTADAVRTNRPPALALAEFAVAAYQKSDLPDRLALERRKKDLANLPKPELIGMGRGDKGFHLQLLLNTRGGSVQQVILTHFQQADREGLPVKNADGSKTPLYLLPGVKIPRTSRMDEQHTQQVPVIGPGPLAVSESDLESPSYVLYHYEKEADLQPADTLGERIWKVARNEPASDGESHLVAFETELGAPFHVKITKTFTLKRTDYHVGLTVSMVPHNRPANAGTEKLRYQINGPHGMPIEGEWYTTTYRQGIVGWADGSSSHRALETSAEIAHTAGSERHTSTERRPIRFAGVMLQYFASVLVLDNIQPEGQKADYIEFVRHTPTGPTHKGQEFLDDLTTRSISRALPIDKPITHPYVLYHGPVKVRLLKQLEGEQAVPEETVDRYRDALSLSLLTDSNFPNWFGRRANNLGWTDILVAFTNLIHSLLGLLYQVVPNLGICIILITFLVRGLLHPFSRRQMINAKVMQAKQEKLAPDFKKIQEKYGDDMMRVQQEKSKLMREHGINPSAMFGGCLLLLCQMPVFMGLYYALQESVFFRLEPFLWMPNLAAPDMLVRWGESIPWLSEPGSLGGMLYLGPYFSILPLIAVALMLYVQMKMMPKSDDPQIQTQQKMMKFMMIMMLFFFYKSPAGLAIYFICSSLWGMVERRLIPKNIVEIEEAKKKAKAAATAAKGEEPDAPKGWLGTKMAGWRARWEQLLEEAQKQQQLDRGDKSNPQDGRSKESKRDSMMPGTQRNGQPGKPGENPSQDDDRRKKKKKKR